MSLSINLLMCLLMRAAPTLPPSATRLERAVVLTNAVLGELPVKFGALWRPDTCPPAFLPHLAWAMSVDRWDHGWTVDTQRSVIQAAFYIHRHKGTVAALRRVIESLGYRFQITEWWHMRPVGVPGSFALDIGVTDVGITDAMLLELERLVDDARPCSRHLSGLRLYVDVRATTRLGVAATLGDELTVYAYTPDPVCVAVYAADGLRVHLADTLTIHPLH